VRFRAEVGLDSLSHCSCSICSEKSLLLPGTDPATFELPRTKSALKVSTFGTGVAQHSHRGMHPFHIPRPHRVIVNARCLADLDAPSLRSRRFFDGRHGEEAQRRPIELGHAPPSVRTARRPCGRSSTGVSE